MRCIISRVFLPSFVQIFDNAQTRPRDSDGFVARTLENERPLTATRIPTCHPWGWFSMSPKGNADCISRRGGEKESASRGEVMGADLFLRGKLLG